MRRTIGFVLVLMLGLAIGAGAVGLFDVRSWWAHRADPQTVASASLQAVREQNRLTPFAARFVAVVTSEQTRLGVLHAQKTLIMPGLVRYEIDLAKLTQADLNWNGTANTLQVTLPPIEVSSPQIDIDAMRQYSNGVLLHFTNAGEVLDAANRRAGEIQLVQQARAPALMTMARDASRNAVQRSFAMPLKAAGLDAQVSVRFADEKES
jgi:hypothetical protein